MREPRSGVVTPPGRTVAHGEARAQAVGPVALRAPYDRGGSIEWKELGKRLMTPPLTLTSPTSTCALGSPPEVAFFQLEVTR